MSIPEEKESESDFSDYWSEYNCCQTEDDETDVVKPTDEDSIDWLKDAGFDFLIPMVDDEEECILETEEPFRPYMRTLSQEQADAVSKRLQTLRATKKKRRQTPKLDVRDVFKFSPEEFQSTELKQNPGTPKIPDDSPRRIRSRSMEDAVDRSKHYNLSKNIRPSSMFDPSSLQTKLTPAKKDVSHWWKSNKQYNLRTTPETSSQGTEGISVIGYKSRGSLKFEPHDVPSNNSSSSVNKHVISSVPEEDHFHDDWKMDPETAELLQKRWDGTDFPVLTLSENPCGVTLPSYLSTADLRKVKALALIELTVLFDNYCLTYSRRKPTKRKVKDNLLFGVSLASLMEQDAQKEVQSTIPLVLQKILLHLQSYGIKEQGILRIPGSSSKIEMLKTELESCYSKNPHRLESVLRNYGINEVTALLKQILRDLPEPLLTSKYMEAFLRISDIPCLGDQLKALNLLVLILPDAHRETLKAVMRFLADVVENEANNKMTLHNVAMIMAPNLFLPRREKMDIDEGVQLAATTTMVTKRLIFYRKILWMVPHLIVKQVRLQTQEENDRKAAKDKKIKHLKKDRSSAYKVHDVGEMPLLDGIFRVHLDHSSEAYLLPLHEDLTAEMAIKETVQLSQVSVQKTEVDISDISSLSPLYSPSRDLNERRSSAFDSRDDVDSVLDSHWMYEVGGNIGSRRLEQTASVLSVCRVNPSCDWIIRCHHS